MMPCAFLSKIRDKDAIFLYSASNLATLKTNGYGRGLTMTTGQLGLLLMLIVGLTAFFAIGIWGINRLKAAESNRKQ